MMIIDDVRCLETRVVEEDKEAEKRRKNKLCHRSEMVRGVSVRCVDGGGVG